MSGLDFQFDSITFPKTTTSFSTSKVQFYLNNDCEIESFQKYCLWIKYIDNYCWKLFVSIHSFTYENSWFQMLHKYVFVSSVFEICVLCRKIRSRFPKRSTADSNQNSGWICGEKHIVASAAQRYTITIAVRNQFIF